MEYKTGYGRNDRVPPDFRRCAAEVCIDGRSFHFRQCTRAATYDYEGGRYTTCKTHSAETKRKREEANKAKFEASLADSRLRAAAPSMLAALEDIVLTVEAGKHWPVELEKAAKRGRAAIAKAKGESE